MEEAKPVQDWSGALDDSLFVNFAITELILLL
jgi:hypothetical protein